MARGPLSFLYKKRVEEIRVSTLSPEQRAEEALAAASEAVTKASLKLEQLKAELQEVDRKYQLSYNSWGVPSAGYGSFEDAAAVGVWWKSYASRFHEAKQEFNSRVSIWAGLKGTN